MMKAWIITWEWDGEHAAVADKVIGFLNPRWSANKILPIIEFIYNQSTSTISEMANYAKKPSNNTYKPIIDFNTRIRCGSNPYIFARKVEELKISIDKKTKFENISWVELPIYEPDYDKGFKLVRGKLTQEYKRKLTGPVSNEMIWDKEKGDYKNWWLKL